MRIVDKDTMQLIIEIRRETTRLEFEAMDTELSELTPIHNHLRACITQLESISFEVN